MKLAGKTIGYKYNDLENNKMYNLLMRQGDFENAEIYIKKFSDKFLKMAYNNTLNIALYPENVRIEAKALIPMHLKLHKNEMLRRGLL